MWTKSFDIVPDPTHVITVLSGEWQDISASGSGLAFTKDLRKLCSTLRGARLCITPSHQQVYMTRARQLPL